MIQSQLQPSSQFLSQVKAPSWTLEYFKRCHAKGRLGHAYLLTGPRGSGKGAFARDLAQALLCETQEPCGQCDSCLAFLGGNHASVEIFSPVDNKAAMDIAQVRELVEKDRMSRSGLSIWIIEEVELLSEASLNALLKTLEEPKVGALLLLTAPSTGSILPTIVSRCQRVPFAAPISSPESSVSDANFLSLLSTACEKGFYARTTPREWIKQLFPDSENLKSSLNQLLEQLILLMEKAWLKWELYPDGKPDPAVLLDRLLTAREEVERNVNPDLILEGVLREIRSIHRHVNEQPT